VLAVLLSFTGAWAKEGVDLTNVVVDGKEAVQVTTGLVRYQFLKDGGVLRSAYVYFSTYGANPLEVVPGWTGTSPSTWDQPSFRGLAWGYPGFGKLCGGNARASGSFRLFGPLLYG
jgi:hypothetical protein